jgi:hypothetical protein
MVRASVGRRERGADQLSRAARTSAAPIFVQASPSGSGPRRGGARRGRVEYDAVRARRTGGRAGPRGQIRGPIQSAGWCRGSDSGQASGDEPAPSRSTRIGRVSPGWVREAAAEPRSPLPSPRSHAIGRAGQRRPRSGACASIGGALHSLSDAGPRSLLRRAASFDRRWGGHSALRRVSRAPGLRALGPLRPGLRRLALSATPYAAGLEATSGQAAASVRAPLPAGGRVAALAAP